MFILYAYCSYGDRTTSNYAGFADVLYETNWYELPIQNQKYFILMMSNAQEPVYYHGMYLIEVHLIFLGKVFSILSTYLFNNELTYLFRSQIAKTISSYYLTFKTMALH